METGRPRSNLPNPKLQGAAGTAASAAGYIAGPADATLRAIERTENNAVFERDRRLARWLAGSLRKGFGGVTVCRLCGSCALTASHVRCGTCTAFKDPQNSVHTVPQRIRTCTVGGEKNMRNSSVPATKGQRATKRPLMNTYVTAASEALDTGNRQPIKGAHASRACTERGPPQATKPVKHGHTGPMCY